MNLPEPDIPFKPGLAAAGIPMRDGIWQCLDASQVQGSNARYMRMYDRLARWYDLGERWIGRLLYGRSIARMRRELMASLPWRPGCRALYVSIGTGMDLASIPADLNAIRLIGADLSQGMLCRCRAVWARKARLELVRCQAEELPFQDGAFDIVFHVGGINFFSDPAQAVREMLRVARPGAALLIADETAEHIERQYKRSLFTRRDFRDARFDFSAIESCIPPGVLNRRTRLLWQGRFYCITFSKEGARPCNPA